MDTLTTIESVEKTPSGAYKITFLGDTIAGTFDEEIGKLAQEAKDKDAPVGVRLSKRQGKLFVDFLELVEAPPVLDGPEETKKAGEEVKPASIHGYTAIPLECGLTLTPKDLEAIADQLLDGMIPIEQA